MTLLDFDKLRKRVAQLQRESDQADGAVAQAMADVKARYGVKTLDEMRALADKLDQEADRIGREVGEQEAAFGDTYGHLLNPED